MLMASGTSIDARRPGFAWRKFSPADDQIGGGPTTGRRHQPCVLERRFAAIRRSSARAWVSRRPSRSWRRSPRLLRAAPGLAPEITIPLLAMQDDRVLRSTSSSWLHLLGRLRDGLTVARANVALQGIWPAVLAATMNPGMPADRRTVYLARTTTLESARTGFTRANPVQERCGSCWRWWACC